MENIKKKNRWHSQIYPKAIFSNDGMMQKLDLCFSHLQEAMTANFFSLQLLLDIIKDRTTVDQAKLRQIYKIFTNNRANQICFSKNMKELIKFNFQTHEALSRLYVRLVEKITLKVNYYLLNSKLLGFQSDIILDFLKKMSYVVRRMTKFKDVRVFSQLTQKLFQETFQIQQRIYELLIDKGHMLSMDQYFIVNGFDKQEQFQGRKNQSMSQQKQQLKPQVKTSPQHNTRIWTIKPRLQTYKNKRFIMAEQKEQAKMSIEIQNLFSFLLKEIAEKIQTIISQSNVSKDKLPASSNLNMYTDEFISKESIDKQENVNNHRNSNVIIVPKRNRRFNKTNTTSILVHQNSSFVLPSQSINKPQRISGFFSQHFRETIRSYSETVLQNKKGVRISPQFQLELQTIMQKQHRKNHLQITENSEESDCTEKNTKDNDIFIDEKNIRTKKHKLTHKNYSICQEEQLYRKILQVQQSQISQEQKLTSIRSIISKYDVTNLLKDDYRKNSRRGLQILRNSLTNKNQFIDEINSTQNLPKSSNVINAQYKDTTNNHQQFQKVRTSKLYQKVKKKLSKTPINKLSNYFHKNVYLKQINMQQPLLPAREYVNKTASCSILEPTMIIKQNQKSKVFLIRSQTQNVTKSKQNKLKNPDQQIKKQYAIKKPFHSFHLSQRKYRIYDTRRRVLIV